MTTLSLSAANPLTAAVDVLVIGLFQGESPATAPKPAPGFEAWADAFEAAGAGGRSNETVRIPAPDGVRAASVLGVGLGKVDELTDERLRRAAGTASRALSGVRTIGSTLAGVSGGGPAGDDLSAAAEGHLLGAYVFDRYKKPTKAAPDKITLFVGSANAAAKAVLRRAVVGAEAVGLARDLVNTAPNDLPPAAFAERAAAAAKTAGLTVQVLDEKALLKGGYGGILGVGAGSVRPPRLVRISYRPAGATTTVALVGKGVCFDSGGLSIKPAQGMDHMTSDMSGAAAVVATVIAAAALKLPLRVIATVPLAENLPSGSAYRPGDVLKHYGGKTVHVLNTDAEGRLILADAIVRAAEDKPDYLIETATLTGAQVIALGQRTMGVMGTDGFRDRIAELAREVGEGGWAMPIPDEMREGLDSSLADLANISWDRSGGMLRAAAYLREFVPDELPWAHLDVAGPAFNTGKAHGYTAPGGTGVPVRTMLAALEHLAANG